MYVIGMHIHLIIRVRAVQDPAVLGSGNPTDNLILTREWSVIFDGIVVEGPIIVYNPRSRTWIFLGYHPCPGCNGAAGRSDPTCGEVFRDEIHHVDCKFLRDGEHATVNGFPVILEDDTVTRSTGFRGLSRRELLAKYIREFCDNFIVISSGYLWVDDRFPLVD
jgi:hypothetical protein